ncbi:MAG: ABC transporter ATP-binding protein [Chloroflexota bacterium]
MSKKFYYNENKSQSFLESIISLFSSKKRQSDEDDDRSLYVLHDISFDVMPGQGFGIIGKNGSGKSTTLKMVARILQPNEGEIEVNGRVSALLELGAGFHPDLSGRENIYLNGSILGLEEDEINALYDDIVTFSGLGKYINMQVKYYSSGMFMRLGFSVAIHVEPDILIVDEILAVGDQAFQKKCLDKITELKRNGTTILMVSHNLNQLQTVCNELIWIEKGDVVARGRVEDVISQYVADSYDSSGGKEDNGFVRVGDRLVEITAVRILNKSGGEQDEFKTGDALTIEMAYNASEPIPNPEFGLAIYREDGVHVNGPNTNFAGVELGLVDGVGVIRYCIESLPLLPAKYVITTAVHDSRYPHCYDMHQEAYSFRIIPGATKEIYGLLQLDAKWESRTKVTR